MEKILKSITEVWNNENYSTIERIIGAIFVVLIGYGIIFGFFCIIGWILWYLYSCLAPIFNWPNFSYWFFVLSSFIIKNIYNIIERREKRG